MASYLGYYDGCASDRDIKFERAVNSFLSQDYQNKELVIVSDGCDITNDLYHRKYSKYENIVLVKLNKQELFSGNVRQAGLNNSTGQIVCYLDTDDLFGVNHLSSIVSSFGNSILLDWCYFDDYIKYFNLEHLPLEKREVKLEYGCIGTSNIAHLKYLDITWVGCDGYGHDFKFIKYLIDNKPKYKKINNSNYVVCHIKNGIDN